MEWGVPLDETNFCQFTLCDLRKERFPQFNHLQPTGNNSGPPPLRTVVRITEIMCVNLHKQYVLGSVILKC